MRFHTYGKKDLPVMLLVHGGGWSYWMYMQQAELLQERYHVVLPVLDGHGEAAVDSEYASTKASAIDILAHIDTYYGGKVDVVSGVSLGGQIVIELLTKRSQLARKAIIESACCLPQPWIVRYVKPIQLMLWRFMASEKAARRSLRMQEKQVSPATLPAHIRELFVRDVASMSKRSMDHLLSSYFTYELQEDLRKSQADILYLYGGKEPKLIKRSAYHFQAFIGRSRVEELPGMQHAELSTFHPQRWIELVDAFVDGTDKP